MPDGSPAPEIKVSKNPQTQAKVEAVRDTLQQKYPTATPEHINSQARSKVANEMMMGIVRRILGKKVQVAEEQRDQAQVESITNRQRAEIAEANSMIDPLTGLHNRRWFDEELPRRMAEARRQGKTIWAVMTDIDHFKDVNDRHGHPIGDKILKEMAEASVRLEEPLVRLGGEEFGQALQDGHTPEQLQIIFSRFSNGFGDRSESIIGERKTISYGVARMEPEDTPESLMEKADRALYHSKMTGRDKVSIFGGNLENPDYQTLPILSPNQLINAQVAQPAPTGVTNG